jgi:hypothetical protein
MNGVKSIFVSKIQKFLLIRRCAKFVGALVAERAGSGRLGFVGLVAMELASMASNPSLQQTKVNSGNVRPKHRSFLQRLARWS